MWLKKLCQPRNRVTFIAAVAAAVLPKTDTAPRQTNFSLDPGNPATPQHPKHCGLWPCIPGFGTELQTTRSGIASHGGTVKALPSQASRLRSSFWEPRYSKTMGFRGLGGLGSDFRRSILNPIGVPIGLTFSRFLATVAEGVAESLRKLCVRNSRKPKTNAIGTARAGTVALKQTLSAVPVF